MSVRLVIGPPGCGKTTYLAGRVRECVESGDRPLVCSLTKTAAAEAAGRNLPIGREMVGTLHSHALHALDCPQLTVAHLDDWNKAQPVLRLSGGSESVDEPLEGREAKSEADKLSQDYHTLRARQTPRELWPVNVKSFATRWEAWKTESGLLDFSDLIEQARDCGPPGNPTVLLVDEAQDHSALELELLRAWTRRAGSLELVGDPWQALYEWRGAHPEMFASEKVDDRNRLVLSHSYRVPRAVHRAAMTWVRQLSDWRDIDYAPRDAEGAVLRKGFDYKAPVHVVDLAEQHLNLTESVMVMAACDYMLWEIVDELRARGLPFSNPWRVKRGDWNPLRRSRGSTMTDRLLALLRPLSEPEEDAASFDFGANARAPTWTHHDVRLWADVLRAEGLLARGAKAELAGSKDSAISQSVATLDDLDRWFAPSVETVGLLTAVLEGRGSERDLLRWWRQHLLPAKQKPAAFPLTVLERRGRQALIDEPLVFVGNIHGFKGAEADTVILFPDLSPAGFKAWSEPGPGRDAVVRQFYVALTRARQTVYVCKGVGGMQCSVWECVN